MTDLHTMTVPKTATAVLVLSDGSVFFGSGVGAETTTVSEICFNTSMTGYQEILTDPSYAGQSIVFTFPHIGNTGTNEEDVESKAPVACGAILRAEISNPSSWRSTAHLGTWLAKHNIPGIAGVDTRALTIKIRDLGVPHGVICHCRDGQFDLPALHKKAAQWEGLEGMDLAGDVTCKMPFEWTETLWNPAEEYMRSTQRKKYTVVAVDYGIKRNILRHLTALDCKVIVVPATTCAKDILAYTPDGIFLSNGPGDPAATAVYAVPVIRELIQAKKPIFGICLGHQLLAIALGAKTEKMHFGHHGANHPIKNVSTNKVEITSQNHGFVVNRDSLPATLTPTHYNLFDNSLAGFEVKGRPIFSVQYHPEASPGPQDSHYLFKHFVSLLS